MFWLIWSITDYLFNCLLHWYLFLDPPTIRNVTTSSKKSWIGQTVTLKCLSDGVPTPTLSWYKPEGSEINNVTARENEVQVPLRGDQDFGHYKCIAANGLTPSDEKLIKISQISKSMRSVYFYLKENYIWSQHFLLPLLIITVSVVLEVKAKFSYKVLDRVTHSLCTTYSIV